VRNPTSDEQIKAVDTDVALTAIFEERAENLSRDELERWSAETERDRASVITPKPASYDHFKTGQPAGSGQLCL
jgi:hypothetical protein